MRSCCNIILIILLLILSILLLLDVSDAVAACSAEDMISLLLRFLLLTALGDDNVYTGTGVAGTVVEVAVVVVAVGSNCCSTAGTFDCVDCNSVEGSAGNGCVGSISISLRSSFSTSLSYT